MKIRKLLAYLKFGFIQLSKHKIFEWQFEGPSYQKKNRDIFEFKLCWTHRCHHAGAYFYFGVFKLFWIGISIYDNRHWDYDNDCFQKPWISKEELIELAKRTAEDDYEVPQTGRGPSRKL
jgi:hypothetical protein